VSPAGCARPTLYSAWLGLGLGGRVRVRVRGRGRVRARVRVRVKVRVRVRVRGRVRVRVRVRVRAHLGLAVEPAHAGELREEPIGEAGEGRLVELEVEVGVLDLRCEVRILLGGHGLNGEPVGIRLG